MNMLKSQDGKKNYKVEDEYLKVCDFSFYVHVFAGIKGVAETFLKQFVNSLSL